MTDGSGEAFYLRDEETGRFWSPTPFPIKSETNYITTHGFGYSKYEHVENGIASEMTVFVEKEKPVKFVKLNLINKSDRSRNLSITGYLEIILGNVRSKTNMQDMIPVQVYKENLRCFLEKKEKLCL